MVVFGGLDELSLDHRLIVKELMNKIAIYTIQK